MSIASTALAVYLVERAGWEPPLLLGTVVMGGSMALLGAFPVMFPVMLEGGRGVPFLFFGVMGALGFIFALRAVPKDSGKSLGEIDGEFAGGGDAPHGSRQMP